MQESAVAFPISFSLRGNNPAREAIHTVFLYHAISAGMTMGIVNAGMMGVYDEIPEALRERVEDAVLNRREDATERLIDVAGEFQSGAKKKVKIFNGERNPSTNGYLTLSCMA